MNNKQDYRITTMTKDEIPTAIAWAKAQGWNPGLHDGECFYQTDPHGFFAGKLDGKIIAMGSAVIYDDQFAFCGFYVVEPAYRGQGYGLALTKARLAYVGERNAGIDGVIPMIPKYERLGYKLAYNNARYCVRKLSKKPQKNAAIIPLSQVDFAELCAYDRLHFPAPRPTFLNCWIKQKGGKSLAYVENGQLLGYAVIRPCFEGFKIGPLFANRASIAEELFIHLVDHAKGQAVYLDIPECNQQAVNLVKRYQLEKVFATARMYLKTNPQVNMDEIYGITTFELG